MAHKTINEVTSVRLAEELQALLHNEIVSGYCHKKRPQRKDT